MRKLLLTLALATSAAHAQDADPFFKRLVVWATPGSVTLPTGPLWKFENLSAYDHANRLVALYKSADGIINASWIIFPNRSGKPTSEGCRKDVIDPLLKSYQSEMSHHTDGTIAGAGGILYPSTSYDMGLGHDMNAALHNTFVFSGDAHTCAELHVSTVKDGPAAEAAMKGTLALFSADLGYQPTANDLALIGTLLYRKDPESSTPFYGVALERLPTTPDVLPARRYITDQLVIALGMTGHVEDSRHFAEEAIKVDPDYPVNYYNLACADAEEDKPGPARTHLEQAFARKQNVLHMPDPAKDDSLLKLKKNKSFWDFVLSLNSPSA